MKKFTFLLTLFLSVSNLFSQSGGWQWSHPKPQGQLVRNIKMLDANNWFVMCDYGVLARTSNAGANWSTIYIGYQNSSYPGAGILNSLSSGWFFDNNNFLLGCQSSRGIVKTTNGGLTYDTIPLSTSNGTTLDFHFINAQTGFLSGTSIFKMMKTTNAGLNWTTVPNLGSLSFYSVYAADENNIITTSSSGNVYITTDGGTSWTTSNVGTTAQLNDSKWLNMNTGYVTGSSGCFRYTTNGGANWLGTNPPTTTTFNRIVILGADIVLVGPSDFVWKSTDNGTTWNSYSHYVASQMTTTSMFAADGIGSTLLIGGNYGIMNKSTNGGNNWIGASTHAGLAFMADVYASSGTGRVIAIGYLLGTAENVIYSTNGGNTWNPSAGDFSNFNISDLSMRNSTTGYICGRFGIFWKTTDGGATWDTTKSLNPFFATYFCNGVDFIDDNTGFIAGGVSGIGGNTKIFKTTDAGSTWAEMTQSYGGPVGIKIDMVNATTGYECGTAHVQKTTDGGATWSLVTAGLNTTAAYNGLSVVDANNVFVSNSSAQIFATSDGGANWTNLNFPITNIGTLFCTDWINANTGMVAGVFGLVGKTTNRGQSWQLSYTGGYTTMGIDMVHPDTAFAVCGNTAGAQVFKYTQGITGTITWNNETPSEYSLEQNYPNPFNPSTTIKFSIPKAGVVSLKVFDITGREVKTLINGLSITSGVVTYDFDASELASGIYFYSLFVDNSRIDTKKMVLVK
jgi:photosystem II stability/assembly factor-like uncharacterized protein